MRAEIDSKMRKHPQKKAGYSLVEMLMVLGVSSGLFVLASSNVSSMFKVQKLAEERVHISTIEEGLRRIIVDPLAWGFTVEKNKSLRDCIDSDDKTCKADVRNELKLYQKNGTPFSGSFDAKGVVCSSSCVVTTELTYSVNCGSGLASCDAAEAIIVNYEIRIQSILLRKGFLIKYIGKNDAFSDEVNKCEMDPKGLPQFVSQITLKTAKCLALPVTDPILNGVKPGSCKQDYQVLVGFTPDGDPICNDIIF